MAPRLHLSGDTLEQVREALLGRYGTAARLVSADKVRDGGMGGLLGHWHVEVVAELPEGTDINDAETDLRAGARSASRTGAPSGSLFRRAGRAPSAAVAPAVRAGPAVRPAPSDPARPEASGPARPGAPAAPTTETTERDVAAHDLTSRSGLAALLAAADEAETSWTSAAAGPTGGGENAGGAPANDPGTPVTASAGRAGFDTRTDAASSDVPGGSGAAPGSTAAVRPVTPELDTPATRGDDFAALLRRLGTDVATGTGTTGTGTTGTTGAATGTGQDAARSTDLAVLSAARAGYPASPVDHSDRPGTAAATREVGRAAAAEEAPAVLTAAGDLVVVLGVGARAVEAARQMSRLTGSVLYSAGPVLDGSLPALESARSAIAARAGAVRAGASAVIGYGLGSPVELGTRAGITAQLSTAVGLGADQVWLVVDARHKTDDVEPWVRRVTSRVPVDGLVVVGAGETSSPQTIDALGLPVGWVDGGPAARPGPAC